MKTTERKQRFAELAGCCTDCKAMLVDELLEWAAGADHQPGCSGGFGYRCKCGRRDFPLPWGQDEAWDEPLGGE